MDLILAIGLNVGTAEPRDQLLKTLMEVGRFSSYCNGESITEIGTARLTNVVILEREWRGARERTVQARLTNLRYQIQDYYQLSMLARILEQESIAVVGLPSAPVLYPYSTYWTLHKRNGGTETGGCLAHYPVEV